MIEVEKQCKPTDEQIAAVIRDAEFVGENTDHDIYYDYPDYSLFKQDVHLRSRNGSYELKIGGKSGVNRELEDKKEIADYFNTADLDAFVKEKLVVIIDFTALRKKYKNGDFVFTIDQMDFDYKICEIELMVETEAEVKAAEDRIIQFADKYKITLEKLKAKKREYFLRKKPEVYKELYS